MKYDKTNTQYNNKRAFDIGQDLNKFKISGKYKTSNSFNQAKLKIRRIKKI